MDSAERIMVMAALAGDDEAFETVIRTYSRRVYVVAYGILQDVPEAEDIVQETFLKAHHQRGKLREPEKFPAWLLTVARNGARDRLRRRRPQAEPEAFDTLPDHNVATPGSALEKEEHEAHLRRALATLPEEHRTALTLRYLEGLDYRAIETSMGPEQWRAARHSRPRARHATPHAQPAKELVVNIYLSKGSRRRLLRRSRCVKRDGLTCPNLGHAYAVCTSPKAAQTRRSGARACPGYLPSSNPRLTFHPRRFNP